MKRVRAKRYNKLVRDGIPALLARKGLVVVVSRLSGGKFRRALREKLIEEAGELSKARGRKKVLNELADCSEVLRAIAKSEKVTMAAVERVRRAKLKKRGGFQRGFFLKKVQKL
jgi:predicted house-cleaning noncanonical NTP pyrophosphatase (MazG superfamily)